MLDSIGRFLTRKFFDNPILVIGSGRSGTSILLQALGQHSQILSADRESPFIPYVGYLTHPFEFRDNKDYHIESLNLPLDYAYESFRKICFEGVMGKHYGLRNMTNNLAHLKAVLLNKRFWCAKTFPNYYEGNGLTRLYPNVKFLYIFRNGYEVVNSRSRFRGMSRLDFSEHCEIWASQVEKYSYLFDLEQAMPVRHEEIVTNPDAVFRQIFQFLGIDYEEGPTQFTSTTHIHPLEKRTQLNVDVTKTLKDRPPAYESWSLEQKQVFKRICGEGMGKLEYEIPF